MFASNVRENNETLTGFNVIDDSTVLSGVGQNLVLGFAFNDTLPAGSPEVPMPVGETPKSLVVQDLVTGSGTPVAKGDSVTVNYTGVSCSTGKIFDSSWTNGKPVTFPLSQVITGWSQGLVGMQPSGRRLLVIPPDLGYGSTGQGGIAPDESLVFVVDLISTGTSATPGTAAN
jgi:peptidylprolyl isomerase